MKDPKEFLKEQLNVSEDTGIKLDMIQGPLLIIMGWVLMILPTLIVFTAFALIMDISIYRYLFYIILIPIIGGAIYAVVIHQILSRPSEEETQLERIDLIMNIAFKIGDKCDEILKIISEDTDKLNKENISEHYFKKYLAKLKKEIKEVQEQIYDKTVFIIDYHQRKAEEFDNDPIAELEHNIEEHKESEEGEN